MSILPYLEKLAASLLMGDEPIPFPNMTPFHLVIPGFVQPKERARSSSNGRHYTPANTRKYEKAVREAAIRAMRQQKLAMFRCPVSIHLTIVDQQDPDDESWLRAMQRARLVFEHTGGDLDNKEKAVLDAINKVVYLDDRLVVQSYKTRGFGPEAGAWLTVTPCGLNKNDLVNLVKLMKAQENG